MANTRSLSNATALRDENVLRRVRHLGSARDGLAEWRLQRRTALAPVIGYDKASRIAHHAMDHDLTLKEAALGLGYVTEAEFDRVVDPTKMVEPYVATKA